MHRSTLPTVALLVALAACSGSSPSPSEPSATDPIASPAASASTTPSSAPTASEAPALGVGDVASVTDHGAGVAVRQSPFVDVPMVSAFTRPDETSGAWTLHNQELRLEPRDQVYLVLGPLCIGELCWYQAQSWDPLVGWDADHDGAVEDQERGWIASGDAAGPYLAFAERPVNAGSPRVSASGTSSAEGRPFAVDEEGAGYSAMWAFATDGLAPCDLRVVLQPGNIALVDESLIGAYTEGNTQTQMTPPGEYYLEVTASVEGSPDALCPWAVVLLPIGTGLLP